MSKLERGTGYYGLFMGQELVRVQKSDGHDNLCQIELLDGRKMEFLIIKEKFSLIGLCKLVVRLVQDEKLPDATITISPLRARSESS